MTTEQANSIFLDLRVIHLRLLNESTSSTIPQGEGGEPKKAEVKTEASIGFSVGLDNPENPTNLQMLVDYKVNLFVDGTREQIVNYMARYEGLFEIAGSVAGVDWTNVPNNIFDPYFAMLQQHAVQRAEQTLLAMGFRGVPIPLLKSFGNPTQP